MTDIIHGNVGPEANYDLKIEGGKLVATFLYAGKQLKHSNTEELDLNAVLNAIEDAIPGDIDNKIFDVLKIALGLIPADSSAVK